MLYVLFDFALDFQGMKYLIISFNCAFNPLQSNGTPFVPYLWKVANSKLSSLGFFLQVIHLWFEDFSIQDSNTCEADFITLKDELGIIGESCAVAGRHFGKTISVPCRESGKKITVINYHERRSDLPAFIPEGMRQLTSDRLTECYRSPFFAVGPLLMLSMS